MRKLLFTRLMLLFAVAIFTCSGAWAQGGAGSRITGVVTDPTGGAIPQAAITLTQTGTGVVHTAVSGDDGSYTIGDLQAATYKLEVKKEGFSGYVQNDLTVAVGSVGTVNIPMTVGSVQEEVTVTSYSNLVETHSNSIGQVVSTEQILDIPLNARDSMQLLTLTPAATVASTGVNTNFNGAYDFPSPFTVAFAGTNPGSGTYILDGGNADNAHNDGAFPLPFPDALQEFKVETSAVPATYGMHSAAVINAITRSGTNNFHGSVFEFIRNNFFNARQYYQAVRDPLKRNQFGGVVGGPISRGKKIFFFAGVQDTIVHDLSNTNAFLPTNDELAGNFKNALSAQCNGGNAIALKTAYANETADQFVASYAPPSLNLVKLLPTPPDQTCGQITVSAKTASNNSQVVGKVDYNRSDKNSFFVRYFFARYFLPPDPTSFLTLSSLVNQVNRYNTATVGWTHTFSPNIVNTLRGNLNRGYNNKAPNPGVVTASQLGVKDFYNPVPNFVPITVGGGASYFGIKNNSVPVYFNATDGQATDDLEFIKGSHQFGFGVNYVRFEDDSTSPIYVNGNFAFTNGTTGLATADFLLGDVATFQQSNFINAYTRKNYLGIYAQDTWQANKKLTVVYGLRWEPSIAPYYRNGYGYNFSLDRFNSGTISKVYPNAPAGLQYPGDYAGFGTTYISSYKTFEPRVGFSFDPTGSGKSVIKASYGFFFDFEGLQYNQQVQQSPPWGDSTILSGINWSNPYANYKYNGHTGNPYPIAQGHNYIFQPGGAFQTYTSLHPPRPNLQQWNLSIQHQFGNDWSVTVSYIGNKGTHLGLSGELDPGTYIPGNDCSDQTLNITNTPPVHGTGPGYTFPCTIGGNTQARRRLNVANSAQGLFFSQVDLLEQNGASSYHGLIGTVQKRMSHLVSFVANYTYSHCINNGDTYSIQGGDVFQNDLSREVGNCTFDYRQQFTLNALIQSPKYKSHMVQMIAGDFQLTPIVSYLSSDWLSVTTGSDSAFMGISAGQRANIVGNPSIAHTTIPPGPSGNSSLRGKYFFNPKAYAAPTVTPGFTGNVINNGSGPITVGPLGNSGRGSLKGPGIPNFDLALVRNFKFKEHQRIEFRAEAFNVLNLVRLYDPTTVMSSSTFGQSVAPSTIQTTGFSTPQDPRIFQFALKYEF